MGTATTGMYSECVLTYGDDRKWKIECFYFVVGDILLRVTWGALQQICLPSVGRRGGGAGGTVRTYVISNKGGVSHPRVSPIGFTYGSLCLFVCFF